MSNLDGRIRRLEQYGPRDDVVRSLECWRLQADGRYQREGDGVILSKAALDAMPVPPPAK